MNKIPLQLENPKGLHWRYHIQKVVGIQALLPKEVGGDYSKYPRMEWRQISEKDELPPETQLRPMLTDTDEGSEYFVMRLDEGGQDPEHIKACRIGVNAYAEAIAHHLPELSKDLKERYPVKEEGLTGVVKGDEDALLAISKFAVNNKFKEPLTNNTTAVWFVDIPKLIDFIRQNYKLSKK